MLSFRRFYGLRYLFVVCPLVAQHFMLLPMSLKSSKFPRKSAFLFFALLPRILSLFSFFLTANRTGVDFFPLHFSLLQIIPPLLPATSRRRKKRFSLFSLTLRQALRLVRLSPDLSQISKTTEQIRYCFCGHERQNTLR